MTDVIIETAVKVLTSLAVTLIGVFGSWLLSKLAKRAELAGIQSATDELLTAAQMTVMELQQTVVEGMKAAAKDGKLTEEEINRLSVMLLNGAKEKMSVPSMNLLISAGADIDKIIVGAGEALIADMHREEA